MNRELLPKPNAECVICGNKYYRCAKCIELKNRGVEAWKLYCDTFECFSVRCLIENFEKGNLDNNALNELLAIKLRDERKYTPAVAERIEVLKELYGAYDAKSKYDVQVDSNKLIGSNIENDADAVKQPEEPKSGKEKQVRSQRVSKSSVSESKNVK